MASISGTGVAILAGHAVVAVDATRVAKPGPTQAGHAHTEVAADRVDAVRGWHAAVEVAGALVDIDAACHAESVARVAGRTRARKAMLGVDAGVGLIVADAGVRLTRRGLEHLAIHHVAAFR